MQKIFKAVSGGNSSVISSVSLPQVVRHGDFIVQLGKSRVGVLRANVKNFLRGLFDSLTLFVGRLAPDKIIVDDIFRVAIAGFETPADRSESSHVN